MHNYVCIGKPYVCNVLRHVVYEGCGHVHACGLISTMHVSSTLFFCSTVCCCSLEALFDVQPLILKESEHETMKTLYIATPCKHTCALCLQQYMLWIVNPWYQINITFM